MSGDWIRTYFRKKCLKKEGKHDILNVSDKWKKFVLGEKIWEKAIHMMRSSSYRFQYFLSGVR